MSTFNPSGSLHVSPYQSARNSCPPLPGSLCTQMSNVYIYIHVYVCKYVLHVCVGDAR